MAIVSVRRQFTGRGASADWERRVTYNDVWEVVVDSPDDNEDSVYGAVDPVTSVKVPEFGDPHPNNPLALVVNVAPDQSEDTYEIWYISIKYDTKPDNKSNQQPTGTGGFDGSPDTGNSVKEWPANPLLEKPRWRLSSTNSSEPIESWLVMNGAGEIVFKTPNGWVASKAYAIGAYVANGGRVYIAIKGGTSGAGAGPVGVGQSVDGTVTWLYHSTVAQAAADPRYAILSKFANSGNMPFDPPGMIDVSIATIVVNKNMPVMDIRYHMYLPNAVNVSQWGIIPPRCAKVLKFEGEFAQKNGLDYVPSTWEIGLNPHTWDTRILDAGYGAGGMRTVTNPAAPPATIQKFIFVRFKDTDGGDIGSPVPMDGKGGMLAPDADPVYLRGLPRQNQLIDFNEFIPWNIPT